jgi:hypothetical protein
MLVTKALGGFFRMFVGMLAMAAGQMGVMSTLGGVIALQVLGSFFVMLSRVPMMLGGFFVVLVMGATGLVIRSHGKLLLEESCRIAGQECRLFEVRNP